MHPVKKLCFRYLNLCSEIHFDIVKDNPVRGGEEGQYLRNKGAFIVIECVPPLITRSLDFSRLPEAFKLTLI